VDEVVRWGISESGTTVALDVDRRGEVDFTVTNRGKVADRCILAVEPLGRASDTWFGVGEPRRSVAPGASVVYAVMVSIPPRTAAGTYRFQAVTYSADSDPGETSAKSKRVVITVPALPAPPRRRRWWPLASAIAVAVVAVLVTAAIGLRVLAHDDRQSAPPGGGEPGPVGGPLQNVALPAIHGTPVVSSTLTATPGKWSLEVAAAFQWTRCRPDGTGCEPIEAAVAATYTPLELDVGHVLRVEVTAAAEGDSATATSEPLAILPASPVTALSITHRVPRSTSESRSSRVPGTDGSWTTDGECGRTLTEEHEIHADAGGWAIDTASVVLTTSITGIVDITHKSPAGFAVVATVRGPSCGNGPEDLSVAYSVTYSQSRALATTDVTVDDLLAAGPLGWGEQREVTVAPGTWTIDATLWDGSTFRSSHADDHNPYLTIVEHGRTVVVEARMPRSGSDPVHEEGPR
jgi:hypothetical protein